MHDTTKAKQQFWVDNKWVDSTLKHYDYAIGVSGGHSVYFIEDFINAKHKIGWIRTDYRVLKRDHNIDQKYFDKMDGMLSVSKMCSDILKIYSILNHLLFIIAYLLNYMKILQMKILILVQVHLICVQFAD